MARVNGNRILSLTRIQSSDDENSESNVIPSTSAAVGGGTTNDRRDEGEQFYYDDDFFQDSDDDFVQNSDDGEEPSRSPQQQQQHDDRLNNIIDAVMLDTVTQNEEAETIREMELAAKTNLCFICDDTYYPNDSMEITCGCSTKPRMHVRCLKNIVEFNKAKCPLCRATLNLADIAMITLRHFKNELNTALDSSVFQRLSMDHSDMNKKLDKKQTIINRLTLVNNEREQSYQKLKSDYAVLVEKNKKMKKALQKANTMIRDIRKQNQRALSKATECESEINQMLLVETDDSAAAAAATATAATSRKNSIVNYEIVD